MRLIDADDVKKLLTSRYEGEEYIRRDVDQIPTAYDVDKVVKQIEDIMHDDSIRFCDQAVNRAINVVKAGGINE
ncbi:MAG: hypothetical protein J6I65_07995 [Lachnospiraceae bacterium]|nr:hypothetical protein [Lachnospiraceae bacterium]